MIDLHLHFEGSIPEDDLIHLAKIQGIELPENFPDCVHADGDKPYYEFNKFALSLLNNKNHIHFLYYVMNREHNPN